MSNRIFASIRTITSNAEVDLEFPGDQLIGESLMNIVKLFNLPIMVDGKKAEYSLQTETGIVLDNGKTLISCGIQNFDVLWLNVRDDTTSSGKSREDPCREGNSLVDPGFHQVVTLPAVPEFYPDHPCLIYNNSSIYILSDKPMIIGRKAKDNSPEIDVSDLDENFIVSRNHALVFSRGGKHYCKPFSTKNGTFLNGKQLDPDKEVLLNKGDILRLGFRGVELEYQAPD